MKKAFRGSRGTRASARLTPRQLEVLYQVNAPSVDHWTPTGGERRVRGTLVSKGLIQETNLGRYSLTKAGYAAFKAHVLALRSSQDPLGGIEEAVIAAVRQEPTYRFVGSELRLARRMLDKGLLRPGVDEKHFLVTSLAYGRYTLDTIQHA